MPGNRDQSRARIVAACVDLLLRQGLSGWTLDAVARSAQCAKGLVLYHFRSKDELLTAAGEEFARQRLARRVEALAPGGTAGLDRLWRLLAAEVTGGAFSLWLALLAERRTRPSVELKRSARAGLGSAAATAIGVPVSNQMLTALPGALDSFQLQLLEGEPAPVVRDRYDRWWLQIFEEQ